MSPEEALGETRGNFAIANSDIRSIKIRSKTQSSGDDDVDRTVTELTIEVAGKKLVYTTDTLSNETKDMLRSGFGDRVNVRVAGRRSSATTRQVHTETFRQTCSGGPGPYD
ncbi:MAG: hypothetical protein IMY84_01035 [Chloroflexi bacterium]|nr:hypothetical protein [Chloroflexota bacterium]